MKKVALLVINLNNYDSLCAPPFDKNKFDITTFYITSNNEDIDSLKNLGWDNIKIETNDVRVKHLPFSTKLIDYKLYPEKMFPEILNYDILISIDGNVKKLSDIFLNKYIYSIENYTLLLDNMYYGWCRRNSLALEFHYSRQQRWKKNWNNMQEAKKRYVNDGFNLNNIKVCSAKYVVINMKNKIKNKHIWEFLEQEYSTHLQGNIIYAIASEKFKKDIIVSSTLDKKLWTSWYKGTIVVSHCGY